MALSNMTNVSSSSVMVLSNMTNVSSSSVMAKVIMQLEELTYHTLLVKMLFVTLICFVQSAN